jgi:hypothetical protein
MNILYTIFISFVFLSLNLFSQSEWNFAKKLQVGKRPAVVYNWQDGVWLVICAGWDENQNGIKDEGDEPPSIWYFETESIIVTTIKPGLTDYHQPKKLMDLDFRYQPLPIRIGLDKDNGILYIGSSYLSINKKNHNLLL